MYHAIRNELLASRQANGSWDVSTSSARTTAPAMALIIASAEQLPADPERR